MCIRDSDTTSDERIVAKDKERKQLIDSGIKSGSLIHTTEFVEAVLEVNNELESTSFHWKPEVLVTYVLDAIQVHNEAYQCACLQRLQDRPEGLEKGL